MGGWGASWPVGAGAMGSWPPSFVRTSRAGRVIVLERGRAGDGASSRAAGIVRAQGGTEAAVALVTSGMTLGLGTGSTVAFVLEALGRRIRTEGLGIKGVPTSRQTEQRARELGIPLTDLATTPELDLAIDGADEVDPNGDMIKGHGGALLWEKIVATATRRLVIVVDPSKRVERLGATRALPVEVVPFGWGTHEAAIRALGARPMLRRAGPVGTPVATDEGN